MIGRTKVIGIALSLVVFLALWFMPTPEGLSVAGQRTLAVTMFTVVWWIFGVMSSAFTTLLMFVAYIVLGLAPPATVFAMFTSPLLWLMVGAFLIATAVTKSGLAKRIAYFFMLRFANSYHSIVVLVYVLGFVLSFLIPHPFPRTLLIMAVVAAIIDNSEMDPRDATALGFATFSSATATSMILLTGDSLLNTAGAAFAEVPVSWLDWMIYMGVPGIIASVLMLILQFIVFPPKGKFNLNRSVLLEEQRKLGPITAREIRALVWVLVALVLWTTDTLHGIDPAWVALAVAVGLALPVVGDVLEPPDITTGINWPILIFVVGALAIGTVGRETGMAQWVASVMLPAQAPSNPFAFALLIGGAAMIIHMFLGSALAVMSIVSPPMVGYATAAGWSSLVPALLVYTAVEIHFLLPFQHVTMLLGDGKTGRYGSKETLKYGLPLTIVAIIVMLLEIPWWQLTGLIDRVGGGG